MKAGFLLTDADRNSLKEIISQVVNRKINTFNQRSEIFPGIMPDLYVGKAEDKIPAMETGDPNIPGEGKCDIYKINLDGELALMDEDKTVYNIGSEISEGFFLVVKLKDGHWLAYPGGGSGRWFFCRLESPLAAGETAYANILNDKGQKTDELILVRGSMIPDWYTVPINSYVKAEYSDSMGDWFVTGAFFV
jgi:hypothetical protein